MNTETKMEMESQGGERGGLELELELELGGMGERETAMGTDETFDSVTFLYFTIFLFLLFVVRAPLVKGKEEEHGGGGSEGVNCEL